eukprot:SAG31_NODE_15995_length_728_cov_0.796502_2_plen_64_part_00
MTSRNTWYALGDTNFDFNIPMATVDSSTGKGNLMLFNYELEKNQLLGNRSGRACLEKLFELVR